MIRKILLACFLSLSTAIYAAPSTSSPLSIAQQAWKKSPPVKKYQLFANLGPYAEASLQNTATDPSSGMQLGPSILMRLDSLPRAFLYAENQMLFMDAKKSIRDNLFSVWQIPYVGVLIEEPYTGIQFGPMALLSFSTLSPGIGVRMPLENGSYLALKAKSFSSQPKEEQKKLAEVPEIYYVAIGLEFPFD